jgi:hypothetical protein
MSAIFNPGARFRRMNLKTMGVMSQGASPLGDR